MKNPNWNSNTLTEEKVLILVQNKTSEGLLFSFKSGKELPLTEKQLDNLAIEVSAFANSIGGTIIFGIESKRKKAVGFSFFKQPEISAQWFEMAVQSRIHRPIAGLNIQFIQLQNDPEKTVLIITVPESHDAPHMAADKRFYKRQNNKFYPMEEFEVRQMYGKLSKANLEFVGLVNTNGIPTLTDGLFNFVMFLPRFIIRNIGSAIEKHYKFEIAIPTSLCDENYYALNTYFSRHEGNCSIFSIPGKAPVFQDEMATIAEIKILVNKNNLSTFLDEKISISLFFSNGMKTAEFKLSESFRYNNIELQENQFA